MRSELTRPAIGALGAAILAFAARIANAGRVFQQGIPVLPPFDELYHWKRITHSVANFPAVLELDPDRGLRGAFCPWPPLYDLAAAVIAIAAGASDAFEVLRVVVWIPPVVSSILIGIVVAIVARYAPIAAAVVAVPLATAPFLVFGSSITDIDHHFLEPFLVLAILGSTILATRAQERRQIAVAASLLAASLIAAMFVQTALIVAAGLSFLCILISGRFKAALPAFAIASAAVLAYRLTRPPDFPDGPWFLGWTHAALLAGAAVGCAAGFRRRHFALIAGVLCIAAIPGMADSLLGGTRFFGGDAWLSSIDEFQPVWRPLSRLPNYVAALALGAIASIGLIVHRRNVVVGVFALAFILATLPTRRFAGIATALGALAAALFVEHLWRSRRAVAIVFAAMAVLTPALQLMSWLSTPVPPPLSGDTAQFFAAANSLRDRGPGRVLAPWQHGHVFDVIGQRPVVLDNFGTMPDPDTFRIAHEMLLSTDENEVARFCDRYGIRFIVLETPLRSIGEYPRFLGLPLESFVRGTSPTAYAQSTFLWRGFFQPQELRHFHRLAGNPALAVLERN